MADDDHKDEFLLRPKTPGSTSSSAHSSFETLASDPFGATRGRSGSLLLGSSGDLHSTPSGRRMSYGVVIPGSQSQHVLQSLAAAAAAVTPALDRNPDEPLAFEVLHAADMEQADDLAPLGRTGAVGGSSDKLGTSGDRSEGDRLGASTDRSAFSASFGTPTDKEGPGRAFSGIPSLTLSMSLNMSMSANQGKRAADVLAAAAVAAMGTDASNSTGTSTPGESSLPLGEKNDGATTEEGLSPLTLKRPHDVGESDGPVSPLMRRRSLYKSLALSQQERRDSLRPQEMKTPLPHRDEDGDLGPPALDTPVSGSLADLSVVVKGDGGLGEKKAAAMDKLRKMVLISKAAESVQRQAQAKREKETVVKMEKMSLASEFNVSTFKARGTFAMTAQCKRALMLQPRVRGEAELDCLHAVVSRLPICQKYTKIVRDELCKIIQYQDVGPRRTVARQGDPATSFFFILSGSCDVNSESITLQGTKLTQHIAEMEAGDYFGETALLADEKRDVTILTREFTEFIRIDKDDFRHVMQVTNEKAAAEKHAFLSNIPLFASLHKADIRRMSTSLMMNEYKPNKVIIKEGTPPEYFYIIKSGKCEVIKEMTFDAVNEFGRPTTATHLVSLRCLNPGDFFGEIALMNQCLHTASVISVANVECLLMNKLDFLTTIRNKALDILRNHVVGYPSDETIRECILRRQGWSMFKRRVVDGVMENKTLRKLPANGIFRDTSDRASSPPSPSETLRIVRPATSLGQSSPDATTAADEGVTRPLTSTGMRPPPRPTPSAIRENGFPTRSESDVIVRARAQSAMATVVFKQEQDERDRLERRASRQRLLLSRQSVSESLMMPSYRARSQMSSRLAATAKKRKGKGPKRPKTAAPRLGQDVPDAPAPDGAPPQDGVERVTSNPPANPPEGTAEQAAETAQESGDELKDLPVAQPVPQLPPPAAGAPPSSPPQQRKGLSLRERRAVSAGYAQLGSLQGAKGEGKSAKTAAPALKEEAQPKLGKMPSTVTYAPSTAGGSSRQSKMPMVRRHASQTELEIDGSSDSPPPAAPVAKVSRGLNSKALEIHMIVEQLRQPPMFASEKKKALMAPSQTDFMRGPNAPPSAAPPPPLPSTAAVTVANRRISVFPLPVKPKGFDADEGRLALIKELSQIVSDFQTKKRRLRVSYM